MEKQQIEIYQSQDGTAQVEVCFEQDTLWLSQAQMAQLFDKDVRTINEHVKNIYSEQELESSEATIRKFRIVRQEGSRQDREPEQLAATEESSVVRQGCLSVHGVQAGGLLKARELFGNDLDKLIQELNGYLIA